jgi:hypothetical protein
MIRQLVLFVLISGASAWPLALSAQSSDQTPSRAVMQAVEAAFPRDLRYVGAPPSGEGAPLNPYDTCAAVFSQSADGTPDLIAAAYSGHGVEVAMLAYQPGAAQIVDSARDDWPHHTNKIHQFDFGGGPCDASIDNLADPTQPDSLLAKTVEISFDGEDWFFLWNGKKLRNITALLPGGIPDLNILPDPNTPSDSYMHNSRIVDVDHRGAMQIVGNGNYKDFDKFPKDDGIAATGAELFFRYNGTSYEWAKTLLLLDECKPPPANWNGTMEGPWHGTIDEIDMHESPAPSYKLSIVNGDRDGSNRVTSAKVEINGVSIVSLTEINRDVETLTRTIQLKKQNRIKVTVDGPAKSHLNVIVE